MDALEIYDCLDLGRRIDVVWPKEQMRLNGGKSSWKQTGWEPTEGMVGYTVHYWQPNHPNSRYRSNFNRTLFLVQIGENFVPVSENGVKEYNTIGIDDRFRNVAPSFDSELSASDNNQPDIDTNECTGDIAIDNNLQEENKSDDAVDGTVIEDTEIISEENEMENKEVDNETDKNQETDEQSNDVDV